jgi:hypothetical protein
MGRESHIVEGIRVLVEGRIKESYGALAGSKTLLVDQGDDTREYRGRGASASHEGRFAISVKEDVLA